MSDPRDIETLTVLSVSSLDAECVWVEFETGEKMGVTKDLSAQFRLTPGTKIPRKPFLCAAWNEQRERAWERVGILLGRGMRSAGELRNDLMRCGFSADVAERTIQKCRQYGWVDDLAFARVFLQRNMHKARGEKQIRWELRRKGIDPQTIDQAMAEVEETQWYEHAYAYARKKWVARPAGNEATDRRKEALKIGEALLRRGFSEGIARKVVRELLGQDKPGTARLSE
jgi:regulatory protein